MSRFNSKTFSDMDPSSLHPDWLDAQYNNRALVPDHAAQLAQWAADSAAVRERARAQLHLNYGRRANEQVDVFLPDANAPPAPPAGAPLLVFLHGGYWRALDKSDHSFVAPAFTARGAVVMVPNYSLCPDVSVPDIVTQMRHFMGWVRSNAAQWGVDAQRIGLVGHSAGGQLAAMLLCEPQAAGATGALSISGVFDLEPLRHAPFVRDALKLTPAHVQACSPARLPAPEAARPLCAVVGAEESAEFRRQTALIGQHWGPNAVPLVQELEGLNHFNILPTLTQPASRLHELAWALLQKTPQP